MTDLKQAAQQALEALEEATNYTGCEAWSPSMTDECLSAAAALRAALEQPEPFQPDWDRIETLQESLREHMAEIHRLRAALEQPDVPEADFGNMEPVEPLTQGERSLLWAQLFGPNLAVNKKLPYVSITVFDKIVEAVERKRGITTPRREWRGLTEEEIRRMGKETPGQQGGWNLAFARAIEAALKEKNHD